MKIKAIYVLGLALYAMGVPVGGCNIRTCNKHYMDRTCGVYPGSCRSMCRQGHQPSTPEQIKKWLEGAKDEKEDHANDEKGDPERVNATKASCKILNAPTPELTEDEWKRKKQSMDNKFGAQRFYGLDSTYGVCLSVNSNNTECSSTPNADELISWAKFADQQTVAQAKERCKYIPTD